MYVQYFNYCSLEINIFTTVPVNADDLIRLNCVVYILPLTLVIYMSRSNNRYEQP